jgi:hypothetical protein
MVRLGAAYCLVGLAQVTLTCADSTRAARLLGTARAGLDSAESSWWAILAEREYDRILPIVRAELDEPSFTASWNEGYASDLFATADELLAEFGVGITETQRSQGGHGP